MLVTDAEDLADLGAVVVGMREGADLVGDGRQTARNFRR